ncbi:MAG: 8-oxo-dGTP diphosphatase [candidate division KSB1 bacterium]
MKDSRKRYARFEEIDWSTWQPEQRATLVFVVCAGRVLLIHKKRGLGAGKINGPGGRIDPGETELACAVREVQEELRITPVGLEPSGELFFQFTDGLAIHVTVFKAAGYVGEPEETEEAKPLWVAENEIPYEQMWADDRLWIPLMLAGKKFEGRFLFDEDAMLGHELKIGSS